MSKVEDLNLGSLALAGIVFCIIQKSLQEVNYLLPKNLYS